MEQPFHATQQAVAGALLDIGAVVFTPSQPVTFKSGIVAPVYVDNRRLPFWPEQWRVVIDALQRMIARHTIVYDVIAGIEAAANRIARRSLRPAQAVRLRPQAG